jgi:hypothetical protein
MFSNDLHSVTLNTVQQKCTLKMALNSFKETIELSDIPEMYLLKHRVEKEITDL